MIPMFLLVAAIATLTKGNLMAVRDPNLNANTELLAID
jgi:hypothetical protein